MNIEIKVTGGTAKSARASFVINNQMAGELTLDRADLTKFADLLFVDGYSVTGIKNYGNEKSVS